MQHLSEKTQFSGFLFPQVDNGERQHSVSHSHSFRMNNWHKWIPSHTLGVWFRRRWVYDKIP